MIAKPETEPEEKKERCQKQSDRGEMRHEESKFDDHGMPRAPDGAKANKAKDDQEYRRHPNTRYNGRPKRTVKVIDKCTRQQEQHSNNTRDEQPAAISVRIQRLQPLVD